MIRKKHPGEDLANYYGAELTDDFGGSGRIKVVSTDSRYVPNPAPQPAYGTSGYWNYNRGHYEYFGWTVQVDSLKNRHFQGSCALRLYPEGFILPASVDAATKFDTQQEAVDFAEKWLAAGGPGVGLETPKETRTRELAERSAYMYPQVTKMLSALTDEDLVRVAEAAHARIAKRAETEAKEALRAEEKRKKAEEKARIAEEKRQKAAAKEEEKRKKAEEKAQKAAAKAARDEEKRKKAEKKAQKLAAKNAAPEQPAAS